MKITGWQLREALKMWELRKGAAEKLFPESLHKFKGEVKDSPQDILDLQYQRDPDCAKAETEPDRA